MKPHLLIVCLLTAIRPGAGEARAEAKAIPDGYKVERYTTLWEHSPFTIASAVEDAPEPAAKLVLAGLAKIGTEDMVTLLNKDSQERMIVTQMPNAQGYKLVSVESNEDPLKVVVTLIKGNESLKVRFDPALLTMQSKSPQAQGPNAQPNNLPQGMQMVPQAMPSARQFTPGVPGTAERQIRRPPIPLPVIPNSTNSSGQFPQQKSTPQSQQTVPQMMPSTNPGAFANPGGQTGSQATSLTSNPSRTRSNHLDTDFVTGDLP